jgi:hypothetical protein
VENHRPNLIDVENGATVSNERRAQRIHSEFG